MIKRFFLLCLSLSLFVFCSGEREKEGERKENVHSLDVRSDYMREFVRDKLVIMMNE